MKIQDVISQMDDAPALVKAFLDKDASGEVYSTRELVEKLSLSYYNFHNKSGLATYHFTLGEIGRLRCWWGNPAAITRLKEEVAKIG